MESFEIIKPGMLTTVQDLGRSTYRLYGVSSSGAMDTFALRIANLLVGNEEGATALEVTLIGPHIKFKTDVIIAITGGNLSPSINGKEIMMWKSLQVKKGDELCFGKCIEGCRAYISFAGGIIVPQVMGSSSTYLRGSYGGVMGRALKRGDIINIRETNYSKRLSGRGLLNEYLPKYNIDRPVRFIWGPQKAAFTTKSLKAFTNNLYFLTNQSDRMGYRLDGEKLHHISKTADIISEYHTIGTIQVPSNGKPIVHMADCGSSGGYTKIGGIISVDIPYVAQKKPGDTITFEAVNIIYAQCELRKQEKLISDLRLNNLNFVR